VNCRSSVENRQKTSKPAGLVTLGSVWTTPPYGPDGVRHRGSAILLQNALGRLNDIEVHKRVAHDIVHRERSPRRADKALAMGFVSGHEDTRAAPCIAAVAKAAKRLADIPPYWR
jgi:hypothetical protein